MNDQSESRELVVAKKVAGALQKMQPEYRAVLPAHISPEAFTRVAQTAIQLNDDLQQCSPRSLIGACSKLAEIGLLPDGEQAAIVAYNVKVKRTNPETGLVVESWEKQAKPMPMVAGIRDLVRRSGQVKDWKVRLVREGDYFKHIDGDVESLVHEPCYDDDAPITHVYSIAYLESGELSRHVMTIATVEKIRRRSRSADKGPWVTDYPEMVKKTCLRQHSKALPKAKDDINRARIMGAVRAIDDAADEIEADDRRPAIDVPQLSMQRAASDRLRQAAETVVFDELDEDEAPAETVRQPSNAQVDKPAAAAPAATRKRRTSAERVAANLGAASGNAPAAPAATPAKASATQAPATAGKSSASASTAPAAAASIEEGRDLDLEREMAQQQMDQASADDDRFPGDIPSGEADGEEPEVVAYRDGWHARAKGMPRKPASWIKSAQEAECWLKGWDAYKTAVDLGNAPRDEAASEAMLDHMVGKVFV